MSNYLVFDQDAALERVGFDKDLLCELVGMVQAEYKNTLSVIRNAIVSNNCDATKSTAHSLKSSVGNIGAMVAFELASQIEQKGKSGDLGGAMELYEKLEEALNRFFGEFTEFQKSQV